MVDPSHPSPSAAVAEALADHRLVLGVIQDLRATVDPVELAQKLDALAQFLEQHFTLEEQPDGLYDAIFTQAPHLQRRGQALITEHAQLLEAVRVLVSDLRSSAPPIDATERVAALGRAILAHEANENQLHGEALYTELGTGD